MLRRALLVSGVLLSGSFGFAGIAGANTATVPFSGTVNAACTFTPSATPGTLNPVGTSLTPNSISGTVAVPMVCNGSRTVTAGTITPTGTTPTTDITTTATVGAGSTAGTTNNAAVTATDTQVTVGLTAAKGTGVLPAGTYTYDVNVTATP